MNPHNFTPESKQDRKTQLEKMGAIKQKEEIIYSRHALD